MFKEVVMWTTQLKEMEAYYVDTLALPLVQSDHDHFTVKAGTSLLTFKESTSNGVYHFAFNIPGNHFEAVKKWLQARVVLNREQHKDEIYYKSFDADAIYTNDPVGNVIEYIARRKCLVAEEFEQPLVLDVSEMSITTPHDRQVHEAFNTIGIHPRNQAPLKEDALNFLGEDPNYIILVPPERVWYFSNSKSKVSPVEMTFTNGQAVTVDEEGKLTILC